MTELPRMSLRGLDPFEEGYEYWADAGRDVEDTSRPVPEPEPEDLALLFGSPDDEIGRDDEEPAWMAREREFRARRDRELAEAAGQDRDHLARIGRPGGTILPELAGRARGLSGALMALNVVKPAFGARYLVKGWLDRGAASVLYGESNVGKTFLALDLALHVAAGEPWHGAKVAEGAGPVIYVAAEGGSGIRNRIEAMRQAHPELMRAIRDDVFFLLPEPLDLHGKTDAPALAEALARGRAPSLIVIDTLARCMGAGDENTAQDMGQFVRSIDLLRRKTGAHVMVVHHSGKDATKGARGSSVLRAAVDTEIELTRLDKVVTAEARKQRDMACDARFSYALRPVTIGRDEDGDPVTSAVVERAAPVKRAPKVTGQAKIALQAFGDALAAHGEVKVGERFPRNRQVVSLERWREFCDRHGLSEGESESANRKAFRRAWMGLNEKGVVKVLDGYAWRCGDDD